MSCVFVDAEYRSGGARQEAPTPIAQQAQPAAIEDASQKADAIKGEAPLVSPALRRYSPERQAFF